MYSEKTFKNYIFWIQVKRVVLIILLSCIGAALGVLVSEIYESITKSNAFNVLIIVGSTIAMFLLSLLCTAGTGKEVQDGYWKVAVLRKLTAIQKLIETNNSLLGNKESATSVLPNKDDIDKIINLAAEIEGQSEEKNDDVEYEEDSEVQINVDENDETENKKESKSKTKEKTKAKKVKEVKEVV